MPPERVRGHVINVHGLGATVRLDDGRLASVPIGDVNANRATYTRAQNEREQTLPFDLIGDGRHPAVVLAKTRADEPIVPTAIVPPLVDASFEDQITAYLKSTEAWAPADLPAPFERHLTRKKRRAKVFKTDPP